MFYIKGQLFFPSPIGFVNGSLHAISHFICIKNDQAIYIACCTPGCLSKTFFIAEKSFFIGIQNSHQ